MLGLFFFHIASPNEVLHHFLDSQLCTDVHKHLCAWWNQSQSRESNRCLSCLCRSIRHVGSKTHLVFHCGINSASDITAVTWLKPLPTITLVGGQDNQRFWFIYSFSLPLKDSGDSPLPSLNFSLPLNSARVNTGNVFLVLFSLWWSTTSPLGAVCSRLRAQWVALTKVGPPPCTSRTWVMVGRKEGGLGGQGWKS